MKYAVHVILPHPTVQGSSFHSVVVEADGFVAEKGYYGFYKGKKDMHEIFTCYPIQTTIVEPFTPPPAGASGSIR